MTMSIKIRRGAMKRPWSSCRRINQPRSAMANPSLRMRFAASEKVGKCVELTRQSISEELSHEDTSFVPGCSSPSKDSRVRLSSLFPFRELAEEGG